METEADPYSLQLLISLGVSESVLIIFALILLNAFFAMSEMALVSVRKTRIKQLVEEGVPRARTVQKLLEDPGRFLATIQIGVTLVGFFASAVGAVTLAEPLASILQRASVGIIASNSYGIAVAVVTLVIGFVSLVIGEISPKSVALQHAERIALWSAGTLTLLSYIAAPIVRLITGSSNVLIGRLGGTASFAPPILTEEELKMLVEAGEEDGVLEEEEKEMIHSVFEFTDTVVRKVMVPRTDMKAVEVTAPIDDLLDIIIKDGHSRVPVYDESIDNILGVIHAKDLLRAFHENGQQVSMHELMRPPLVIPENKKVDELLAEFKRNKIQMAIVADEYGGTAGLVTIEDLVEEIFGDIMDEYDLEQPLIEAVDDHTFVIDARMPIDEVNEQIGVSLPEEEFDTVGGFVFGMLGKQPEQGEIIHHDGVELAVQKTDGRRIEKVRVTKPETSLLEKSEEELRD